MSYEIWVLIALYFILFCARRPLTSSAKQLFPDARYVSSNSYILIYVLSLNVALAVGIFTSMHLSSKDLWSYKTILNILLSYV